MKISASYSTLCGDELSDHLLTLYTLDEPAFCRFWQRGVNDTYQVHVGDNEYSLRVYRHGLRTEVEIQFEIAALNYLHECGAKVAYPIPKRDDSYLSVLDAPEGPRFALLTAGAPGAVPDYDDDDNARAFGESVAELHGCADGFATEYERTHLVVDDILNPSLEAIRRYVQGRAHAYDQIEKAVNKVREAISNAPLDRLDYGLCHGDCHGSNVHEKDGVLTHFDFDCCGLGLRVYDLATFKWGCTNDDNASQLWSSFLKGYTSIRDIRSEDLALVDFLVAIRHVWWVALIMGNARDFGYGEADDDFVARQFKNILRLANESLD